MSDAPLPSIDAWMQHPTGGFLGHEMFASLRRWIGIGDDIPDEVPFEMTRAIFEAAGVKKVCASAWWGPDGPIITNDEVAKLIADHPDFVVGMCSVNLHDPMNAVRELRRCVKDQGFKALRIIPWLWGLPPDDRRYYPLYAECIELGVPFCLQVGHTGPLRTSETGRPIPYLDNVALEFPELVIVGGHIGYPWTDEMIALTTKYPNVYIDTSAYKTSRFPPQLVHYMQRHGRKKVLFGTNFPMIQPGDALKDLASLGLDEEATRLFLHDNAARVFGL